MKVSNGLLKVYYRAGSCVKRNSSTILTCAGAVGVVGTAIMAVRATPKALLLIEKAEEKKRDSLTKLETVQAAGIVYIPSIIMGLSTIGCIFGANVLNKRQQAALTSAYALVENTYKEYRGKVKELLGDETDTQIRDAIIKDKVKEDWHACVPGNNSLDLSDDVCLFYDEVGDRYFEARPSDVFNAEYHLNRNFTLRGCANLNEFYMFLGLDETEAGETLGWSDNEFIESGMGPWIDFDHMTTIIEDGSQAGLKCVVIYPTVGPSAGYDIY